MNLTKTSGRNRTGNKPQIVYYEDFDTIHEKLMNYITKSNQKFEIKSNGDVGQTTNLKLLSPDWQFMEFKTESRLKPVENV